MFIKACDLYKRYAPRKDPYRIDIEYQAALVYYDHAQYDQAKQRFAAIAERMPKHRLASFAADFLLDSYILEKDYIGLNKTVDRLIGLYPQNRSPELYGRLVGLKQKSEFNNCRALERSDRSGAARCFVKYADAFEGAELADDALFNAAFNFLKDKETKLSNQALAQLVGEYPKSSLRKKALFQLAVNFKNLAIFSLSSKYFENFAKAYPTDEKAEEALITAAIFQEGLGKFERAIEIYLSLVKRLEKQKRGKGKKKAAKNYYKIGRIYEERSDWKNVVKHYRKFLKRYQRVADPDLVIQAYAKIGKGHWAQADAVFADYVKRNQKGDKPIEYIGSRRFWRKFDPHAKKAKAAYKRAFDDYVKAVKKKKIKKVSTRLRDAVAEARFRMGEVEFFDFFHRNRLKAKTFRDPRKFKKRMAREIGGRAKAIVKVKKIFDEVLVFKSPTWTIASLTRSGQMRALLGKEIDGYPAPKLFTEDMKDEFRLTMANLSEPQRKFAVVSFRQCLDKSRELRWFNSWSDLADRALANLDPANYRYSDEIRVRAVNFGSSTMPARLLERMRTAE